MKNLRTATLLIAIITIIFPIAGAEWDDFTITNLQVTIMDNNMVLATSHYQAKYKKNGTPDEAQLTHLWTFKDGKVVRFQQYAIRNSFQKL